MDMHGKPFSGPVPSVPIRSLTAEEAKARPATCFGCDRDAVVWQETRSGKLLGYCGYLDSGSCLVAIMAEHARA